MNHLPDETQRLLKVGLEFPLDLEGPERVGVVGHDRLGEEAGYEGGGVGQRGRREHRRRQEFQ